MSFKSGSLFKPNDNALRGDFVKSIHALAGYPTLSSNDPKIAEFQTNFPEVPLGSTYYDAAVWAYAKGILTGILNNQGVIYLGLDEPLTREQAATFFYRLYNQSGVTFHMRISGGPSYTTFTDYASVHTYAQTPINWATTHYIIEGAGNYLYPLENLKRAELAKMILNFCNSTKKG